MNCPVCSVPMIVMERHRVELDCCLKCHGLWFDQGELQLLAEAMNLQTPLPDLRALPPVKSEQKPYPCPRCKKKLDKVHLGSADDPVLVDHCPQGDGLWFDKGELEQVMACHQRNSQGAGSVLGFVAEAFQAEPTSPD